MSQIALSKMSLAFMSYLPFTFFKQKYIWMHFDLLNEFYVDLTSQSPFNMVLFVCGIIQ